MVWLAEIVVVLVIGGVGAAGWAGLASGGFDHLMEFAQQSPQLIVARLAPALVICAILAIPIGGAMTSIFAAPWARALLDLRAAPPAAVPPAAVPPPEPTPELSASEPTPPPRPGEGQGLRLSSRRILEGSGHGSDRLSRRHDDES